MPAVDVAAERDQGRSPGRPITRQATNPMQPLPQRRVTVVVTVIADSDDRAREIVDEMTMTDGSTLDYVIVDIRDVRAQEPPQ